MGSNFQEPEQVKFQNLAIPNAKNVRDHVPPTFEPVAIIGMAMRLPGRVYNAEDFWNMLVQKRSGMCDVPKDRFNIDGFYHPSGKAGTIPQNRAYYLDDIEIQQFDSSVFPISKKELERLDPAQRQILQIAYECMEDAGISSWRGSNTGCYVGTFGEDWLDINAKETQHRGGYRGTGWGDFVLANRISYEFDLHGPSMTVKTACSSSLVCLDMACEAIRNVECDGALVGGTSLMFSPTAWQTLHDQSLLSPTGECRTFDASANGYARGEAINMIYVKRLSDALRDKDPIRAVIRGTAVNTDGRTQGMTIPSPTAQAALIRRTYEVAGIMDLSETALVECHGTGTPVGDPIEVEAVARCFGDKGVTITGVKPNVGHAEGAAGITSVIKSVLALEHHRVPPNINFDVPNPKIPFDKCKLHVPTEVEEWPQGRAERISVNSFGIGGVNAHVIIESCRQFGIADHAATNSVVQKHANSNGTDLKSTNGYGVTHKEAATNGAGRKRVNGNGVIHKDTTTNGDARKARKAINRNGLVYKDTTTNSVVHKEINGNGVKHEHHQPSLLLFSAYSASSLAAQIDAFRDYIKDNDAKMSDLAYTLANRREPKPHRAYAVAEDVGFLEAVPGQLVAKKSPRIIWIFTGQGAQWPEMGAALIDSNATFRETIHKLDRFLLSLPVPPQWTIEGELRKVDGTSRVHRAEFGHPLSIALQIALIDLLRSWKIEPDAILGHSSGEMAAAYASGAITAEGAMAAATFRGTSNVASDRKGSMAAVGLGREEVLQYLIPGVVVACDNSQLSVTLSGDTDGIKEVMQTLKTERPGTFVRLLKVEKAFHSPHMSDYGPSYEEHLKPFVSSVDPKIPFYSSVTGKRLTGKGSLEAGYWRQNMESPVLFNSALRAALFDQTETTVVVEIGPHTALSGPVGQILRDIGRSDSVQYVGTLSRGKGCQESLLHMGGKLFQQNVPLDYSILCPGNFVRSLPRYSWNQDTSHWLEPRIAHDWRFREYPPHELLGARVFETPSEPCWRKVLALEDVPWLTGHEVNGQIVFPAAGYIAMVGEALRQLEGEATYSLKNVRIANARVLEVDQTVELVTSVKPIMIDTSENSPWYTFTISSFDGTKWVKNVTGEARASMEKSFSLESTSSLHAPFPRAVDSKLWYKILTQIGLNYTGLFQGMQTISAATNKNEAIATIPALEVANGGRYSLHPAVIDQCFQLFTVAAARGLGKNTNQLVVPTFIGEMVVSPSELDLHVQAKLGNLNRASYVGDMMVKNAERQVLHLKDFRTSALTSIDEGAEAHPLISQLEWKPHCDFVDLNNHMHPLQRKPKEWHLLEELILLCSFEHLEGVKLTEETPQHLSKFLDWMQLFVGRYISGANTFVSNDKHLEKMSRDQRLARIEEIIAAISTTRYIAFSNAIQCLFKASPSIFTGETHPLHVLLENDALTEFYNTVDVFDYSSAIQLIGNTTPRLRVLEVGAGTGGTTAKILDALKTSYGERLYSSYKYTDISSGFMAAAKKRFADFENIEYAVLDVSKSPLEQGFQSGSFDLILGANVIHATPSLPITLAHLHELLSPGGRLFLEELCPNVMFVNYVMGFLSGWWLGAEDNRAEQPYISPERWTKELVAAGFQAPEAIVLDYIEPYQVNAGIIASRASRVTLPSRVTLLCPGPDTPYVAEMRHTLEVLNIGVDVCQLLDQILPGQDVISLLDFQEPVVHGFSEQTFGAFISHLKSLEANMLWVIPASQVDPEDPRAAMTLGLARTARSELLIKLFTIEVDTITSPSAATEAIAKILLRVKTPEIDLEHTNPDYEFAVSNSEILIPRLHWQTMSDAFKQHKDESCLASRKRINVKTPGLLHTLVWNEDKIESPLEGEVLVQAKAAALNFRDLMIALGVLNDSPEEIGLEGSGIVQAVGPGVKNLSIGDRVLYMGSGCFSTYLTMPETSCVKIGPSMTFEQAAGVPAVYTTALMALVDKANLQRGQSILIHSACGGVGLAAIQISQMIGADIYCTVGSETKIQYLVENYGIERSRIFNSRDSSFLTDVMRSTDGRGVDLVLNSLSGDLLHASWKCVAAFGTMVEIGKRDFRRRAKLPMEPFEQNRTFIGLDIWQVSQVRKEIKADLLARCVELIRSQTLRGPPIDSVFPASQLQDAFRVMQTARHIGKIVVQMPENQLELESTAVKARANFRPDRTYLLIGGLGGLGRSVATWMVENGARNFIFLSRSARDSPETHSFLEELRSQDCEIQLVAGSVSNISDVERAVNAAAKPLAGVIQMSMVLKDIGLDKMTFSDWTTAVEPKVHGTWNLHKTTMSSNLDFFILFSSYGGFGGNTGQANYAAANTFLDAFVQYRHRNGLVASVIDVGVMADVGFVARTAGLLERLEKTVMRPVREKELLDTMILAKERSQPSQRRRHANEAYTSVSQILLGLVTNTPISSAQNRVAWKRDMRMSIYYNLDRSDEALTGNSSEKKSLKSLLASEDLSEEDKTLTIAKAIGSAVANFLIKDEASIPLDVPLESLGMDSLVAMEVRNWIGQQVGVEAKTISILQSPSLLHLADEVRQAISDGANQRL